MITNSKARFYRFRSLDRQHVWCILIVCDGALIIVPTITH
jgi:hypothetical protein